LGRREDGFHELETILHPVAVCDVVEVEETAEMSLCCEAPGVPVDRNNLAWRAAELFLSRTKVGGGVGIHLTKRVPAAAGLGGGSSDAAATLLAMDELFGTRLGFSGLSGLAAELGSDVPFFLQDGPALGTGRGERIEVLPPFRRLCGAAWVLAKPGFGVPTAWAYKALGNHPVALNGRKGRASEVVQALLEDGPLDGIEEVLYNSLEAPVFDKYPLLKIISDSMRQWGAVASMMSGSGSTIFGIARSVEEGRRLSDRLREGFGDQLWVEVVAV